MTQYSQINEHPPIQMRLTQAESLFRAVLGRLLAGLSGHWDCGVALDGQRPQESHGHGGRVDDADVMVGEEREAISQI